MSVKIIKREYRNQFYGNGSSVDWLLGNVGEWLRLELTFEASIDFIASNRESINIDNVNNALILNNGKKWSEYGFDLGDDVVLTYVILQDINNNGSFEETSFTLNLKIKNIYNDVIEVNRNLDFNKIKILPTDRGNFKIQDVKLTTIKEPQGLKLRYSNFTNDNFDTKNIKSIIDNTVTEFSYSGLDKIIFPNIKNEMNPDGLQSGMAIEKAYIEKVGNSGYLNGYQVLGNSSVQWLNTIFIDGKLTKNYSAFSLPLDNVGVINSELKHTLQKPIPQGNINNLVSFTGGDFQTIFFYDSKTSGIQFFDLDLKFKVLKTNENSNKDRIDLCFIKYKDGGNLDFSQVVVIKSWSNASGYVGRTISYKNIAAVDLNIGESLALAVAYFHPADSINRWVDIQPISCTLFNINTDGDGNKYKATIDFMLPTLFDLPTDLENNVMPRSLFNSSSLTDNFEIEVFPEWNNPNTSIKNNSSHTERLGNTGWFNENYNGLDNNFKVESLKYKDEKGNILNSLDYNAPVIVEAVVSGVNSLSSSSEFGFGFAYIPQDESEYKELKTPYHKNLFINTGRIYTNGVNDSFNLEESTGIDVFKGYSNTNARMDVMAFNNIFFTTIDNGLLKFSAKFIPTLDFSEMFNKKSTEDRNYVLWLSVADKSLRMNFSDRVSLLLDYNSLIKNIPPAGSYPNMKNKFIEHPQEYNAKGVDKYIGFLEDDILSRVSFEYDTNDNKHFRRIVFGYEVENKSTKKTYELLSYPVNLDSFQKDVDGVQNINIDENRGYKMSKDNNKNWVKIFRDKKNDVGTLKKYNAFFATKIRWEDWLKRENVPIEFFDESKANNGYNNNWLDYLRAGKLQENRINFVVYTELVENGELKAHKNKWEIFFSNYDENLNIETKHEYYRNSDNTLLNVGSDPLTGKPLGVILNNEPTRIEITYTNLTEDFVFDKIYSVTTIEIDGGPGEKEHRQLSTVWKSESDNILIPLQGETKLKIEKISNRVLKTSCLIDNNRLPDALRYKISGRIGCFSEGNGNHNSKGLYEERYENKYE